MALAVRPELAMRSYGLTGVRILDLLILSVTATAAAGPDRALRRTDGKAILVRSGTDA